MLATSLGQLRSELHALKATGEDGIEGLLAESLAVFSGLTIRLAKSGSQFGRDGSSGAAAFAIAMEAKRYDNELGLETLAGKVTVAGHELQDKVDVWALGATAAVGAVALQKLTDILDEHAITLLALDWVARPLPPLAVLLAATRGETLAWFQEHRAATSQQVLAAQLDAIAADPSFQGQLARLRDEVTAAKVGLDALRRRCAGWLQQRLGDPGLSQLAFGQTVAVARANSPAQPRPLLLEQLAALGTVDPTDPTIVAVLGSEGTGKTWLVAQWWLALAEAPIFVFVSGRRALRLVPDKPLESLAQLLAEQLDCTDEKAVHGWHRRLQRWKGQGAAGHLRFIVVLDGINERPTLPWADVIKGLAREAQALGGILVVTSRNGYWDRDVFPRLQGTLAVRRLEVGGYTDEELRNVLAPANVAPADLSPKVREFVRNPRACAVALNMLDRLELSPNELTVDSLLLEYWRERLQERGHLIAHNVDDFEKLLRSHAEAWLRDPGCTFDRDEWSKHSGAAQRFGLDHVWNDLTEIEEGRFLQIVPGNSGAYEFRNEVVPYALGLLITAELKQELRKATVDPDEHLDRILDPIRGFDRVAEIVAAATGLACLDAAFPPRGRVALIEAWLGLQNIDNDAFWTMAAYVSACPGSFLDVLEWPAGRARRLTHDEILLGLVIEMRDRPSVQTELASRVPRWLGRWSRRATLMSQGDAQVKRQTERDARIERNLASLSREEMALFRDLTFEEADGPALRIDNISALLVAGRPIAAHAPGLLGWALAQSVARETLGAYESIAWVVRLNPVDWAETKASIRTLVEEVNPASSTPMRNAAATILRMLGDKVSSDLADSLQPLGRGQRWRAIENFCNTNPHDPDAPEGTNLSNARNAAVSSVASAVWNQMSSTIEDHNVEMFTPALARFDPPVVIRLLREIAVTAANRTGLSLRQLSWRLVEISPIFDSTVVAAVRSAYDALVANPDRQGEPDPRWIASSLLRALAPHFPPEVQLELLLGLPENCPLQLNLRESVGSLPADALERRLEAALATGSPEGLARVLFFASSYKAELTPRCRSIIANAFTSVDVATTLSAADVIYAAEDPDLDDLVLCSLGDSSKANREHGSDEFYKERAIAAAVARRRRGDLLSHVHPRFLGSVAMEVGGQAWDLLGYYINHVLDRLQRPVTTAASQDMSLYVGTSDDGFHVERWVREKSDRTESRDPRDVISDLNDPLTASQRYSERQKMMTEQMLAYERAIAEEGAADLIAALPSAGLQQLVASDPSRFDSWMSMILGTQDPQALGRMRNFGLSLAGAYATQNAAAAASVFRHLRDVMAPANVIVGHERIPLYEKVLFSAPDAEAVDSLRREVFGTAMDDGTIEMATLAAEVCGSAPWLGRYIAELVASSHPADQARGVTIAGFREVNQYTDQILAVNRGGGFLGEVAAAARKCYRRAAWAQHWLDEAAGAYDPTDFWRFSRLAEGVADARLIPVFRRLGDSPLLKAYGGQFFERLKKAAEERSKKRAETLFGLKAPEKDIARIIRDCTLVQDRFWLSAFWTGKSVVSPVATAPSPRGRLTESRFDCSPTYLCRLPVCPAFWTGS